jgi:hypothetical protein
VITPIITAVAQRSITQCGKKTADTDAHDIDSYAWRTEHARDGESGRSAKLEREYPALVTEGNALQ